MLHIFQTTIISLITKNGVKWLTECYKSRWFRFQWLNCRWQYYEMSNSNLQREKNFFHLLSQHYFTVTKSNFLSKNFFFDDFCYFLQIEKHTAQYSFVPKPTFVRLLAICKPQTPSMCYLLTLEKYTRIVQLDWIY